MYNWKIQQGEGGQQKTTVDKKRVILSDLVMLTVSGTERVILSEGEGRDVVKVCRCLILPLLCLSCLFPSSGKMDNGKGECPPKADNGRKFRGQPRRLQPSSVSRPFKKPRNTGAEQVISVNADKDPKPKRSKPTARPRWVYEAAVSAASPYWDVLAVDAIRSQRAGKETTIFILPHSPL